MAQGGSGNDVEVKFGAQIDELKDKLGEVQGIFKELTSRFALFAAAVAGGAAFKEFISEAVKLNGEAGKLARTLGITTAEAGTLNTALGDIGADADTYTGAFLKFNRTLRANGDELKALGVDVDGFKSGLKTSNQVFEEAIQIVGRYKPGIDQTQVAMQLFGRNFEDVHKLMKLNNGVLEEARKKNQELNLTITAEGLAATKAYKAALNDVGDVLTGLKKTIGEAVMPMFTESANRLASIGPALVEGLQYAMATFVDVWQLLRDTAGSVWQTLKEILTSISDGWKEVFGKDGPTAMEVFRNALTLVKLAVLAFQQGIDQSMQFLRSSLDYGRSLFVTFAEVAAAALRGDFAGAKAAWQQGVNERLRIVADGAARMVDIAVKGRDAMDAAVMAGPQIKTGTPGGAPKGGTLQAPMVDKGAQEKAAALAAAMAQLQKAQEQASLAMSLEYLRQSQAMLDDHYALNLIDTRTYYDAKLTIELAGMDATLGSKRREMAELKKLEDGVAKPEQKLKFQAQQAQLAGEINVLEGKRNDAVRANAVAYREAEKSRQDAMASTAAGLKKSLEDDQVGRERADLEQLKQLRKISADDAFKIQRDLQERSHTAELDALNVKLELARGDLQRQAEINAEIEVAQAQHQSRMLEIDRSAAVESARYSIQAQQSVQQSFQTLFGDLLAGVKSIDDVFRNFAINLANTFTNLIAQKFTERLFDVSGINSLVDSMVNTITGGIDTLISQFAGTEARKLAIKQATAVKEKAIETGVMATKKATVAADVALTETAEGAKSAATVLGATTRETAEVSAAATSKAVTGESAIFSIGAKAWEAAASVYAAVAEIPYVGWILAPAMAVAAGAAVLGFANRIFSSEGGEMQVGADRLNFVHKDETILPANFAGGLRKLVGEGGVTPVMEAVEKITGALKPGFNADAMGAGATGSGTSSGPRNTDAPLQMPVDYASPSKAPFRENGPANLASPSTARSRESKPGPGGEPPALGFARRNRETWQLPSSTLQGLQAVQQGAAAAADAPGGVVGLGGMPGQPGADGAPAAAAPVVNFHISAMDGQSVKRVLMEHGRSIAQALQNQGRNFVPVKG